VLTLVAVFAVDANSTVWVLHNEDPNYATPPFDDSLTGVDRSGEVVLRTTGFNIYQTIGGHRALAVSDADHTVVVCENAAAEHASGVPARISKWDYQGNQIFAVAAVDENERYSAVDVRSDGTIYALISDGMIYGVKIQKISPDGNILAEAPIGGFDLVVDEVNGGIYVVGADIKYCNFDLGLQWTIDPIKWCAVSVDTCSDGTAWVLDRKYGQPTSCLYHVSPSGEILQTVDNLIASYCIRVDKQDDSIYVASNWDLLKYNSNGVLQWSVPSLHNWSLAIDAYRRGIWVGTKYDVCLISFDGSTLLTLDEFPGVDQKYVACPGALGPGAAPIWPDGSTVTASDVGLTTLSLAWSPAVHEVGVAKYLLFESGMEIGRIPWTDTTSPVIELDPNTEYTFKVEACDWQGNCTSDGPSVTVRTLAPVGAIQELAVQVMALNLHNGIENQLDAKLNAVLQALDDINTNNDDAAINVLGAFIAAVEAQSGNKITTEDANALKTAAEEIIAVLSGP
jgi:hypothetical protein